MKAEREKTVLDFRTDSRLIADFDAVTSLPVFWYGTAANLCEAAEILAEKIPSMQEAITNLPPDGYFKKEPLKRIVLMLRGMEMECLLKGLLTQQGVIKGKNGILKFPTDGNGKTKYKNHDLTGMAEDIEGLILNSEEVSVLKTLSIYIEIGRLPFRKNAVDSKKSPTMWIMPNDEILWNGIVQKIHRLIEKCSPKKSMQNTYIDKLAFIEIRNRKVLETCSFGKDKWYIPGGKREGNESDKDALIRELKEELLVDIMPETIAHYGTFEAQAHGKPEGTMVRMTCYTGKYTGELTPSAEVEKMDWFDYSRRNDVSPVDQLIFDDLKAKNLID